MLPGGCNWRNRIQVILLIRRLRFSCLAELNRDNVNAVDFEPLSMSLVVAFDRQISFVSGWLQVMLFCSIRK